MADPAPGTAGFDLQNQRRVDHRDRQRVQRQVRVADLLNGLGIMAQQLGAVRRSQEAQANEGAMAQMYGRMAASPQGVPGTSGVEQQSAMLERGDPYEMGAMVPAGGSAYGAGGRDEAPITRVDETRPQRPWSQEIAAQAGQYRPASVLENIGRAFTGIVRPPQGQLTPSAAVGLIGADQAQRAALAEASRQREELGIKRFTAETGRKTAEKVAERDAAKLDLATVRANQIELSKIDQRIGAITAKLAEAEGFENASADQLRMAAYAGKVPASLPPLREELDGLTARRNALLQGVPQQGGAGSAAPTDWMALAAQHGLGEAEFKQALTEELAGMGVDPATATEAQAEAAAKAVLGTSDGR